MSYRRDALTDESIPLPIETVYNSDMDAMRIPRKYHPTLTKFFHNGNDRFNKLYFNYPPEWKTSNIGEKIIEIRKMSIHWKDGRLEFMLYIRKYRQNILPDSLYNDEDNHKTPE